MNEKEEKQNYRQQLKFWKREKRRALHHAKGLSVLFGVLSLICVVLTVLSNLFDQTFYILTKSEYYQLEKGSEESPMYFTSDFESDEACRDFGRDLCEELEAEGAVLLKNDNSALPLEKGSALSLFSESSVNIVYGGTGSGSVDTATAVNLKSALEEVDFSVNDKLWDFYESGDGSSYQRTTVSHNGTGSYVINEVPWDVYTDDVIKSVSSYGDAAIVVLGRIGGEGVDLPTSTCEDGTNGNYLELNPDEIEMMTNIKAMKDAGTVKKIIVLLSGSNAMELDFLDDEAYGIDACLWIGGVGETGTKAVAQILCGETVPSGHLADTFCRNNLTSPAVQNFGAYEYTNASTKERDAEAGCSDYYLVYAEGIYVGYRYYETRYEDTVMGTGNSGDYQYAKDVAYPFGYGLSYTSFEQTNLTSTYLKTQISSGSPWM